MQLSKSKIVDVNKVVWHVKSHKITNQLTKADSLGLFCLKSYLQSPEVGKKT